MSGQHTNSLLFTYCFHMLDNRLEPLVTWTKIKLQNTYRLFASYSAYCVLQRYKSRSVIYNLLMAANVAVSWLATCSEWEHRLTIRIMPQHLSPLFWVTLCCSVTLFKFPDPSSSSLVFPQSQYIHTLCHPQIALFVLACFPNNQKSFRQDAVQNSDSLFSEYKQRTRTTY